jgi:hypothetical protein
MKTPLLPIQILSIYKTGSGSRAMLPSRMAMCTPDTLTAILKIRDEVEMLGGQLFLSDLFRSYDMQLQAHLDYTSGKKKAYSPPPGGSMHEAGRAFDMDLSSIKISLQQFWDIAAHYGVTPIIKQADPSAKEAWHFDCRGSHGKVYDYYASGKGKNFQPYQAMAASAIIAANISYTAFEGRLRESAIQFHLVKLDYEIGNVDGLIGQKTMAALAQAGLQGMDIDTTLVELENRVQSLFPDEYRVNQITMISDMPPDHVIN